eukprot:s1_g1468.t1
MIKNPAVGRYADAVVASVSVHPLAWGVAVLVFAGTAPHLIFSLVHGEVLFYFGAWDEDFYGMKAVENDLWHAHLKTRLLSSAFMKSLYLLLGSSADLMYIAADILLPAACLLSAFYCAAAILDDRRMQVLAAVFVVLGAEVMSLSTQALPPWYFNMTWLIERLPESWRFLVVDNRYTYLNLFRTPEPQFSAIPLFLALGAMLRLLRSAQMEKHAIAILLLSAAVAPVLYGPVWFVLTLAAGVLPILALVAGHHNRVAVAIGVTLAFLAGNAAWWGYQGEAIQSPVFESRWPILSVSTIWSIASLVYFARQRAVVDWRTIWPWLVLLLLLFPVAVLNQQVVTGQMIMPRLWDISVNYYLVAIGVVCLMKLRWDTKGASERRDAFHAAAPKWLLAFLGLLLLGHATGSAIRFPANIYSIQQRAAFEEAIGKLPAGATDYEVVLPTPHAALFAARTGAGDRVQNRMSTILMEQRLPVFAWLMRQGISPDQLSALMTDAVAQKEGYPWLFMFYTPLESWEFYSNHRAVDYGRIAAEIPSVQERYRAIIADADVRGMRPAIVLSEKVLPELNPIIPLRHELVGTYRSDIPFVADIYAYIQTPVIE